MIYVHKKYQDISSTSAVDLSPPQQKGATAAVDCMGGCFCTKDSTLRIPKNLFNRVAPPPIEKWPTNVCVGVTTDDIP